MADKTAIEWTDATWNPIRGCSKVSDGCRHCYAASVASRFSGSGQAYEGLVHLSKTEGKALGWNGNIRFVENHLLDPLRWKRPRRIFVNSMSDLFHENVTDEMRDRIFAVMALCPQHTFQVLTKRPERMFHYLDPIETWNRLSYFASAMKTGRDYTFVSAGNGALFLKNVWLGVSVENQQAADERIPLLLQTPAAVRFLSCEPLLGPVNLRRIDWVATMESTYSDLARKCEGSEHEETLRGMVEAVQRCDWSEGRAWRDSLTGAWFDGWDGDDSPEPEHATIDWVIAGGESGRKARPMHPDWVRSLRDQCAEAGVPFFFKQWGEWAPVERNPARNARITMPGQNRDLWAWVDGFRRESWQDGPISERVGKKAAGHLLDAFEHHAFPEVS